MFIGSKTRALLVVLQIGCLFGTSSAIAALGEPEFRANRDAIREHAFRHTRRQGTTYSVHEITSPTVTMREYTNVNGTIFAVTWEGQTEPDLASIFGTYMNEFTTHRARRNMAQATMRRQPLRLSTPHMQIEKFGHLGDMHGRALLRSEAPAFLRLEDLQ